MRNEEVFVRQALRNVAAFCDRIYVLDHMSGDRTPEILREVAEEYGHLEVRRAPDASVSHAMLEPHVGKDVWVLRVDGDELFDPRGLGRLRDDLLAGLYRSYFRVQANVLHCVSLDDTRTASGWLSPPSRPITSLFNLGAVDVWTGCRERLHAGAAVFRLGYSWESVARVAEDRTWEQSPLRYLHVCFLPRSSHDSAPVRLSLAETGMYRRDPFGALLRAVRRPRLDPQQLAIQKRGSNWKLEKYRRGPLVTVDASVFFTDHEASARVG